LQAAPVFEFCKSLEGLAEFKNRRSLQLLSA